MMAALAQSFPSTTRSPCSRSGAEAALSFLREHEARALNLSDFEPADLYRRLVALGSLDGDESRVFLHVVGLFLSLSMIGHAPYLGTWDVHAALAVAED